MAFKNTNLLRKTGIKKNCFNIVTMELDNRIPKSMPNSPTDYIVLGLGRSGAILLTLHRTVL